MDPVRFGLIGIGGFGASHRRCLNALQATGKACLVAAADTRLADLTAEADALRRAGVRLYEDAEALLKAEPGRVDILALPVGIPFHAPLTIAALEAGYDVYCEKPAAGTIDEVDRMLAAVEASHRFCAVGYQFLSSPLIRRLKCLLLAGRLGQVESLACYALWPRTANYYGRNAWAGSVAQNGIWTLDGPLNNALAHQLMNLLYLGGPTREAAALPRTVQAEFYRAHPITGEDTDCLRAQLETGPQLFITLSHACTGEHQGPFLRIRGTQGVATGPVTGPVTVHYADGRTEVLPGSQTDLATLPFHNTVDYYQGASPALHCPLSVARAQTLTLNAAYESARTIHPLPERLIHREPGGNDGSDTLTWVDGLPDAVLQAFEQEATFAELGLPWAHATNPFEIEGYKSFSGAELSTSTSP